MKTLKIKKTKDIFVKFLLSNEGMINVRGGDIGEANVLPPRPPVKI